MLIYMASSILLILLASQVYASTSLGLNFHHRYSDKVRSWSEYQAPDSTAGWPQKGTAEYYSALASHDHALLRRRGLVEGPPHLTFADGNETYWLPSFGFLHHAEVELGTPNVTFLVALDTGSNTFWVPCDCQNCTPTFNEQYNISFNVFNSSGSSTCEEVHCSSHLCQLGSSCSTSDDPCPYEIKYYDNSSSKGFLVEDFMYFVTDDEQQKDVQARVTFGCGKEQPGSHPVPNGILGLGMGTISVPSTLTAAGLAANSLSMCFGDDGSGRIKFGDKGSPDQNTTSLYPNIPIYAVLVTSMLIGSERLDVEVSAYFDTGASFTLLADPLCTQVASKYNEVMQRQPLNSHNLPFDYCYEIEPNERKVHVPTMTLIMEGGKEFHVPSPVVYLADSAGNILGLCLAIMRTSDISIIGQNFMTGYKIVFDRDKLELGWKEFDCYMKENATAETPASPEPPPSSPGGGAEIPNSSPILLLMQSLTSITLLSFAFAFLPRLLIMSFLNLDYSSLSLFCFFCVCACVV